MTRLTAAVCLATLSSSLALGQTKSHTFEAADVHASPAGTRQEDGGFFQGRVELHGATMLSLISYAYGVEEPEVLGGPSCLGRDRFDIVAKAPAGSNPDADMSPMLKALLQDRFQLAAHQEKRDMPVFILTAKKGIKLTPAAEPDAQPHTARGEGDPALNNHVKCLSYTMAALAVFLPQAARNFIDHPVIDETHLKGVFDFQLDWMGMGIYRKAKAPADGPPAIGAIEAVEKLGLHLDPGTHGTEVVVVDSVNQTPTPNPAGVTAKIPSLPTEFDAAEVRPPKPLSPAPPQPLGPLGQPRIENGRVEIMSATLKGLLGLALNIDARVLVGAPKWMEEDRFDVIAKTAPEVPFEALRGMLKGLLMERFQIVTHSEEQPMPVYVLEAGKALARPGFSSLTPRSSCPAL